MLDNSIGLFFCEKSCMPARHGGDSEPSSPLSLQAQDDARRGYVSPYPPLPTLTTLPSGQPTTAITSMQTKSQPSSSASSTVSSREDAENVRAYTSRVSPSQHRLRDTSFNTMSDATKITQAQKQALVAALNERRVNTVGELRRIERIFAGLGHSDLTEPMTSAWVHYVNSNSLLTELRGLTRNYPFSSECVDEGKRRVHQDPVSNRSWNYCWLVLAKIHTDGLISTYARAQAARPEMWGGRIPQADTVYRLAQAFAQEWCAALAQLLRYWESAPIR